MGPSDPREGGRRAQPTLGLVHHISSWIWSGSRKTSAEPDASITLMAGTLGLQPAVVKSYFEHRSPEPILTPELPKEREGIVPNVVFPTAIDRRDDLGLPGRFDVYYGMADKRIGVARLDLPEHLPK